MGELINKALHSKLAQNGMWLIVLQGFNTIIPILTLPYITRILSKSAYGDFALALNWVGYFQVIVEYGFGLTGARNIAMQQTSDEVNEIHSSIIFARIFLIIICYTILGIVFILAPMSETQLNCTMILSVMIIAIAFQQNWFFQGIQEMRNIAIINVISRTISVALIFLCVKKPEHLYLYCVLYISNFVVSSCFGCIIVRFKYKVRLKWYGLKRIFQELKEGWYLFISSAMTKIFGTVGVTILGFIAVNEEVGAYAAINKIPYVLILIFSAIAQAIYPSMCQTFVGEKDVGIERVKRIAKPIVLVFTFGSLLLMIFNRLVVHIAFGVQYENDSLLLIPFCIWVIASIINNFLGIQTLVASGHNKEYGRAFIISVIIMLILMFVLGYLFKAMGIAIAQAISEITLSFILLFYIRKVFKNQTN